MYEERKQALLAWLNQATNSHIVKVSELSDCSMFLSILSTIPGISLSTIIESNAEQKHSNLSQKERLANEANKPPASKESQWKQNYLKLKEIYNQIQSFIKTIHKEKYFYSLSTLNLVEMSKGENEQNFFQIINCVLIICINTKKEEYISCIMELKSQYQEQLMEIIQEQKLTEINSGQIFLDEEEEQKNKKMQELYYKLETFINQNESLREQLLLDRDSYKKIEEVTHGIKIENARLKKEIDQKNYQLDLRNSIANNVIRYDEAENQEIIEELKNKIYSQEVEYLREVNRHKEKIEQLEEELDNTKHKNKDLEEKAAMSQLHLTGADHSNCINIQVHRKSIQEYNSKYQDASKNQLKFKLENLKLTNLLTESQNKYRKLDEEMKNSKKQFALNPSDGQKLQLEFLSRLKDNLKEKLNFYKNGNNPAEKAQKKHEHQVILKKASKDDENNILAGYLE